MEALARTHCHLPTAADIANFESDAAVRLIERVLRNARPALEAAQATPGTEVPVTIERTIESSATRLYIASGHLVARRLAKMRANTAATIAA